MKEGEGEEGERGEGACRGGATILQPWCVFINKLHYQFIAVPIYCSTYREKAVREGCLGFTTGQN